MFWVEEKHTKSSVQGISLQNIFPQMTCRFQKHELCENQPEDNLVYKHFKIDPSKIKNKTLQVSCLYCHSKTTHMPKVGKITRYATGNFICNPFN